MFVSDSEEVGYWNFPRGHGFLLGEVFKISL